MTFIYPEHAMEYADYHANNEQGLIAWYNEYYAISGKPLQFTLDLAGEKHLSSVIFHLENFVALLRVLEQQGWKVQGVVEGSLVKLQKGKT